LIIVFFQGLVRFCSDVGVIRDTRNLRSAMTGVKERGSEVSRFEVERAKPERGDLEVETFSEACFYLISDLWLNLW
jgi:hypothetical protein